MNLEQQVCSLDLARQLKELGVKQDSIFWWRDNDGFENCDKCDFSIVPYIDPQVTTWFASAFTVAELGEMLPKYIQIDDIEYYYTQIPSSHCDKWIIHYRNSFNSWNENDQQDVSEANCRAKILIHLIEQGFMKPWE